MMSGIKQSICKFYNRKTFITEILNVTTHPRYHHPATKLFRVKEQRETKGRRKEFRWEGVKDYFFFSPRLFGSA